MRKQRFLEQQAAQEQQQAQQAQQQKLVSGTIQSLAGMYVQGQQDKAKATAFGQFLGMHGETLGVKPEDIAAYAKMPRREQLQLVDFYTGQPGQQVGRMQYLNNQAALYPRGSGGTSGGGSGGDYVVGQGWQ